MTAAPPNCVIREVVSVFTDNHPERKRKAEEMANLDEHSKSLDRFFERRGRKRGDGEARSPVLGTQLEAGALSPQSHNS